MAIGIYLQLARDELNSVTRPLTEADQFTFDQEEDILNKEEDLLYRLVGYLQHVGYIQTNTPDRHWATTKTTTDGQ
jgi:hypothetical protein